MLVSDLQLDCSGRAGLPGPWGADIGVSYFHAIPWTKPSGYYRGELKCSFGLELPILDEFFPLFLFPSQDGF